MAKAHHSAGRRHKEAAERRYRVRQSAWREYKQRKKTTQKLTGAKALTKRRGRKRSRSKDGSANRRNGFGTHPGFPRNHSRARAARASVPPESTSGGSPHSSTMATSRPDAVSCATTSMRPSALQSLRARPRFRRRACNACSDRMEIQALQTCSGSSPLCRRQRASMSRFSCTHIEPDAREGRFVGAERR